MATLDLPAWGYGIRYTYGIFKQIIRNGAQVEMPDYWLTFGNPWEIERVDIVYPVRGRRRRRGRGSRGCLVQPLRRSAQVRYYGSTRVVKDATGAERSVWEGGEIVQAIAYDNPIPGASRCFRGGEPRMQGPTPSSLLLPPPPLRQASTRGTQSTFASSRPPPRASLTSRRSTLVRPGSGARFVRVPSRM